MLAHLRRTLNEFISNETGFVRQRNGLPVAWAVGVLVAAAVMFGTVDPAAADQCAGLPVGHCQWVAQGSCCNNNTWQNEVEWCKVSDGCYPRDGRCNTLPCGF